MAKKKGPIIPGFSDKVANKLPENYADTVETMQPEEVKKARLDCQKEIDSAETDMENDVPLKNAKAEVKLLSSAYREALVCEKAKIKYLLHVSRERGYPNA